MRQIHWAAGLIVAAVAMFTVIIVVDRLAWRAQVVFLRARGEITDIGWTELLSMLMPGSPIWLGGLPETRNVYASITNPETQPEDAEAGRRLFQARCAICHGGEGRGGSGPELVDRVPKVGSSDWALFRTIRDGLPGTAMQPHRFSDTETWQLAAYVRSLSLARAAGGGPSPRPSPDWVVVSPERLVGGTPADPNQWLTYSGSYAGHRHSPLRDITPANVSRLQLLWSLQTGAPEPLEATPLVNGQYFLITLPPDGALAMDAGNGTVLWRIRWPMPKELRLCCGAKNRGIALAGENLYVGTLDGRLLAFRARTGKFLWEAVLGDFAAGHSVTAAPLVVRDMVVVGVSGGVLGVRGFLDAYDARTGKRRWRFYTVPEPGRPGAETWPADAWKTGGAAPWMTGSYDPELDLIYWGVGNPSPVYNGDVRPGDNLFSDSVLALDPDDGTLRWHFQFTPHDVHDMDAAQTPLLYDAEFGDRPRQLILWPNRNGFYYVLDRVTGEFLLARAFTRQTWAEGIDELGRPIVRASARPSPEGTLVYPSPAGATNWWGSAVDPATGLIYVPVLDRGMLYFAGPARYEVGQPYLGGSFTAPAGSTHVTAVVAVRFDTGEVAWRRELDRRDWLATIGGVMSTAGGLVFVGDDTEFFALRADSGEPVWKAGLGGPIMAAPISYTVDGRQRISVVAGTSVFTFGLPEG